MVIGVLSTERTTRPQAGPAGIWTFLGTQPPGRYGHGFVYDPRADRFIAFGGAVAGNAFTNSTWSFDYASSTWANITPAYGPSPRAGFGMVYDARAERVIVFGGFTGTGSMFSNETWAFDPANETWTNRTSPAAPPARELTGMVYDFAADRTILFGGFSGANLEDTWAYNYQTNAWTRMAAVGPSARSFASLAYDIRSDRVVLYGGAIYSFGYSMLGDTWVYDYSNDSWTEQSPASHPPDLGGSALAYDTTADRALLFGGGNLSSFPFRFYNVTWAYDVDQDQWSNVTPALGPSARFLASMDYDAITDRVVLFAGGSIPGLTPILEDDAWSFQYSLGLPSAPRNLGAAAGDAQVVLTWQPPPSDGGSPITNYTIYRGTTSGGETLLTTLGDVLTYIDTPVTNGQTYHYQVSALTSVGEGPKSNEASATPIGPPTPPSAPLSLQAAAGAARVTLSWQAPASNGGSAITAYTVYRGLASGGETQLGTIMGNVDIFNDTTVTNGYTYYYEVSAVNGVGEGPRSNEVAATPTPPPDTTPPTIAITSPANHTTLTTTTVTVRGTASDDVTIQTVELSTDGTTWTVVSGTTSWSGSVTLQAGTNVIYARATDTSGNRAIVLIMVNVETAGPAPSGIDTVVLAGILVAVAAVGAAAALIARRRSKSKTPPQQSAP